MTPLSGKGAIKPAFASSNSCVLLKGSSLKSLAFAAFVSLLAGLPAASCACAAGTASTENVETAIKPKITGGVRLLRFMIAPYACNQLNSDLTPGLNGDDQFSSTENFCASGPFAAAALPRSNCDLAVSSSRDGCI